MSELHSQSEVLSVSQVTRTIKSLIERHFPEIWVRGEISNFVRAASGHCYFSLKDDSSQARCVLFRSRMVQADFEITDGIEVELLATPSMFEKRGEFQLIAQSIRKSGLGRLFALYEEQKRKLSAEGLFDASKKKPLPRFPRKIGVVTSKDAAALRDVCKTLADRAPGVPVIIYHSPVQGVGAGKKLADAVSSAVERLEVDVLIICRGGGSLEDLWEFNSEELVRAIAGCPIPVVSGVGHETDTTLVDFVSDYRAPTPTAAASAVVYSVNDVNRELKRLLGGLVKKIRGKIDVRQQQLDYLNRRLIHPGKRNALYAIELNRIATRMNGLVHRLLRHQEFRVTTVGVELRRARPDGAHSLELIQDWQKRIHRGMVATLNQFQGRLSGLNSSLSHLDPEHVLSRGYAIVRNKKGDILRSTKLIAIDDQMTVQLQDGELEAWVAAKRSRDS
ncbi:MAG: exodeoxyribonuclease VII large subunit [Proteobacteria bacterium]|nr:exodeoxyribonuclease VII large subunit [Pseudomonadota bacterium]MDA1012227.1 exodeoxyribonuclease VII large subunit [Pseudomonadota bacterium]